MPSYTIVFEAKVDNYWLRAVMKEYKKSEEDAVKYLLKHFPNAKIISIKADND